jgi:hypothetical protein
MEMYVLPEAVLTAMPLQLLQTVCVVVAVTVAMLMVVAEGQSSVTVTVAMWGRGC